MLKKHIFLKILLFLSILIFGIVLLKKLSENFFYNKNPIIKNLEKSLEELSMSDKSICRFGDGELCLIANQSIEFQKFSPEIKQRLLEVLSSQEDNILIGFPYICYHLDKHYSKEDFDFWNPRTDIFKKILAKYTHKDKTYYSSEISILYHLKPNQYYDVETYFKKVRNIWEKKDITIICGKTIFDDIKYNIFDNAKTVEYMYVPAKNAFESYPQILSQASNIQKNRMIILILGPTATILSYDLAKKGYRALDLGHIAKSYDWWKKKKKARSADGFFNPD